MNVNGMKWTVIIIILFMVISINLFCESRSISSRDISQNNFNEAQYISCSFKEAVLGNEIYYKILVIVWYNQSRQGQLKIFPHLTNDEVYMQFNGVLNRDGRKAMLYIRRSNDNNSSTELIIDTIKYLN
jgi:hypothetical protein